MDKSGIELLYKTLRKGKKKRLVMANGIDVHSLETALKAGNDGLAEVYITGVKSEFELQCRISGFDPLWFNLVDCATEEEAVVRAVQMAKNNEADLVMKGFVSTDQFMKALLNKHKGLWEPGILLTHVTMIFTPTYFKPLLVSDVAIIPKPTFEQKIRMTRYLIDVAHKLGISNPNVAFIAATEQVIPGMEATTDAQKLKELWANGNFPGSVCDGPMALDIALDAESARIKNFDSPVAGNADCLLFPNIEAGNIFYKTNTKLCRAETAAIVVGTKIPVVLSSRGDTMDVKLNSIALAATIGK